MSRPTVDFIIRRVRSDEVATFRAFRLRALADAPTAFGQSLAHAEAMPWDAWVQRVTRAAAGRESLILVAVDPATDDWLGITGSYFEDDTPTIAEIVSVWVAPEARRRGVARQLLAAASAWAQAQGARELHLWVTETNHEASELYRAAGFAPTGLAQPLPSNPAVSELAMSRTLPTG